MTWKLLPSQPSDVARKLAHCEALIAQVTTGMVLLEPANATDPSSLQISMVNQLAACYFGRIGHGADAIVDTERGLRESGLYDLALMVSLTDRQHFQESVAAWGAAAAGQRIDLTITPLGDGVVSITFDDVTHRANI